MRRIGLLELAVVCIGIAFVACAGLCAGAGAGDDDPAAYGPSGPPQIEWSATLDCAKTVAFSADGRTTAPSAGDGWGVYCYSDRYVYGAPLGGNVQRLYLKPAEEWGARAITGVFQLDSSGELLVRVEPPRGPIFETTATGCRVQRISYGQPDAATEVRLPEKTIRVHDINRRTGRILTEVGTVANTVETTEPGTGKLGIWDPDSALLTPVPVPWEGMALPKGERCYWSAKWGNEHLVSVTWYHAMPGMPGGPITRLISVYDVAANQWLDRQKGNPPYKTVWPDRTCTVWPGFLVYSHFEDFVSTTPRFAWRWSEGHWVKGSAVDEKREQRVTAITLQRTESMRTESLPLKLRPCDGSHRPEFPTHMVDLDAFQFANPAAVSFSYDLQASGSVSSGVYFGDDLRKVGLHLGVADIRAGVYCDFLRVLSYETQAFIGRWPPAGSHRSR